MTSELEFGHIAVTASGCRLDTWGTGPFIIYVGEKSFRFEDSARFGPYLIAKDGRVLEGQPAENSPFWAAHLAWGRQGRQLEPDGVTCIYRPLKPTRYRPLPTRELIVVEEGDPDGGAEVLVYGRFIAIREDQIAVMATPSARAVEEMKRTLERQGFSVTKGRAAKRNRVPLGRP